MLTSGERVHWGNSAWHFLHSVSFAYPDNPSIEDKKGAFDFIQALPFVLPCEECRQHAFKYIHVDTRTQVDSVRSVYLSSKHRFAQWMYDFHNAVNLQTEKPPYNITIEELYAQYDKQSMCGSSSCKMRKRLMSISESTPWAFSPTHPAVCLVSTSVFVLLLIVFIIVLSTCMRNRTR